MQLLCDVSPSVPPQLCGQNEKRWDSTAGFSWPEGEPPILPLTSTVMLDKLFCFLSLSSLICKMGIITVLKLHRVETTNVNYLVQSMVEIKHLKNVTHYHQIWRGKKHQLSLLRQVHAPPERQNPPCAYSHGSVLFLSPEKFLITHGWNPTFPVPPFPQGPPKGQRTEAQHMGLEKRGV